MNTMPPPQSEIQKPRSFTATEWQELLRAAHSGWFQYVFGLRWILLAPTSAFVGVFAYSLARERGDFHAALTHLLHSGFFTWGIGFMFLFRVSFASIDWSGKRKLARQLNASRTAPLPAA